MRPSQIGFSTYLEILFKNSTCLLKMNPFNIWRNISLISQTFTRLTPIILTGVGSINIWQSTEQIPQDLVVANRLNAVTCFTASSFYIALNLVPVENRFLLRCCDWLITCPLLIIEICKLLGIKSSSVVSTVVSLTILMIASGVASISNESYASLGFVCLSAIYAILASTERDPNHQVLPIETIWSFLASWMLFGAVFYIRDPSVRDASYSILDIYSKGVFGMTIAAAGTNSRKTDGYGHDLL